MDSTNTPKPWYHSRTLWLNALTLATLLLAYLASDPLFVNLAPYIATANALLNIVLRFLTSQPIGTASDDAAAE
jgi:hypothetical protein